MADVHNPNLIADDVAGAQFTTPAGSASIGVCAGDPNGVVEHGTLCQSRADGTTVWGVIKYDEADMAAMTNGALFDDMTAHGMGHVLGFGTSLKFRSFVSGTTFTGASACSVWTAAVCPPMVATRDHWAWNGDIMSSGITDFGAVSPVTEAAMRDAGYTP